MGMREKIIELLMQKGFGVEGATIAADHLIANGVTIPVRCKECKYLYDELDDYCCTSHRGLARICENSFCSYGERRITMDDLLEALGCLVHVIMLFAMAGSVVAFVIWICSLFM